jgi:hypothetical protein
MRRRPWLWWTISATALVVTVVVFATWVFRVDDELKDSLDKVGSCACREIRPCRSVGIGV